MPVGRVPAALGHEVTLQRGPTSPPHPAPAAHLSTSSPLPPLQLPSSISEDSCGSHSDEEGTNAREEGQGKGNSKRLKAEKQRSEPDAS